MHTESPNHNTHRNNNRRNRDMEMQIVKKQIMHYYRIKSNEAPDSTTGKIATDPKNPWLISVEATMASIEINTEELMGKNPNQAKGYVNNKLKEHQIRKYTQQQKKNQRSETMYAIKPEQQ